MDKPLSDEPSSITIISLTGCVCCNRELMQSLINLSPLYSGIIAEILIKLLNIKNYSITTGCIIISFEK